MIVKIQKAGASFKSLAGYLTDEGRVAWTHSLNCAHDDVLSVVNEMYTTFKDAELLKQQAGVHAGGSSVEKPVKHYSLSWHPSEHPTREEIIEAAESFLKDMGAEEHQAFLVSHNDKPHAHVHIMLNRIHPERGTALNERFEKVRAQDWALDHECEQGKILCEQRLLEREERTASPNRRVWEQLREYEQAFEREEQARRTYDPGYLAREERREVIADRAWELLKQQQREEREAFFAEGKEIYKELRNGIYQDVREIARPAWAAYYEAQDYPKQTLDDRLDSKKDLASWQKALVDERFAEAAAELRQQRDQEYKLLLERQKEERHELTARQEQGLSSYHLLDSVDKDHAPSVVEFKEAAKEVCEVAPQESESFEAAPHITPAENPRVRQGLDMAGDVGMGLLGALGTIGERLFDGFFGGPAPANQNQQPKPEPKREIRSGPDSPREQAIARAVEAALRAAEHEQEQRRDSAFWRERERGRGD